MFEMDNRCEELSSDAERMHDSIQSPEVLWGDDWWRDLPPEIQVSTPVLAFYHHFYVPMLIRHLSSFAERLHHLRLE